MLDLPSIFSFFFRRNISNVSPLDPSSRLPPSRFGPQQSSARSLPFLILVPNFLVSGFLGQPLQIMQPKVAIQKQPPRPNSMHSLGTSTAAGASIVFSQRGGGQSENFISENEVCSASSRHAGAGMIVFSFSLIYFCRLPFFNFIYLLESER